MAKSNNESVPENMKVGDCSIGSKEDKSMDLKPEAEGLAVMVIIGLILFIALVF